MSVSKDPFMQTMRGHYPASDNAGAARHWADANGVPLPDRSIGTLFWLSLLVGIFGLDHFYLRSPMTGMLKLLTAGGFGLWWLWDVLQITSEKERVKMYGLSTPLDLTTGVGQGMITDKTNYVQKTSFIAFSFLAMLGLEALIDGKFAQLIRRVVDMSHFLSAGYAVLNPSLSLVARFFAAIPAIVFGLFALLPWFAVVSAVVSGAEEGIVLHPSVEKLVNYFSFYTRSLGTKVDPSNEDSHSIVEDVLREEFGYTNVPAAEFQKKFRIVHREELSDQGDNKRKETTSKWMPALWMGPLVSGVITRALMAIPLVGAYVKMAVFNVFGDKAAAMQAMIETTPMGAAASAAAQAAGIDPSAVASLAKDPKALLENPLGQISKAAGLPNVGEVLKNPQGALAAAAGGKLAGLPNMGEVLKNPQGALAAAAGGKLAELGTLTPNIKAAMNAAAAVPGAGAVMNAVRNPQAAALKAIQQQLPVQGGGARGDALSTESKVLGAALFALIVGGGIKGIIDHVVTD